MGVLAAALLALLGGFSSAIAIAAAGQGGPSCSPQDPPLAEAQRKFHPGHYVSIGGAEPRSSLSAALTKGVVGVQLRYRWADLEPAEGNYQFLAIARDLEALAASGSQLVVLIEDKSFDDALPTPAYLHKKYTLRNRNGGYTALRWDPYVVDRLTLLVARLGAQFDCHPNFEGVAFQESSLSLDDNVLDGNGYTPEKYRDALIRLLRSAAESMPRSRVFWYMNFLPRNQDYIAEIASTLVGTGVVMGGPDVLPDNPALARRVYPLYDKFRGRLKLFNSMQHNSYRHQRAKPGGSEDSYWSMEDLFVFARDELHVDYVFWEYRTWRKPADSHDWVDARQVIARHPTFSSAQQP
jgi:hypothetical protein